MSPAPLFDASIVIPTLDGRRFLETCLASVRRQSLPVLEILVVDNGSRDGTAAWLAREYPEVVVISLEENRGFGCAVNAGIVRARGQWVLLLNNDIELAPDCLERLQSALRHFHAQRWFALKMLQFNDRQRVDGAGDAMFLGGAGYRLGTMERDGPLFDHSGIVFGACAGAALYHRSFFERVGLFDGDFFAYLEDLDLNIRAARQGLPCRYLPQARVYHIGSATSGSPLNPFTARLTTRNMFFILLKHYPSPFFVRCLPMILCYHLAWFLFMIRRHLTASYLAGLRQALAMAPRMLRKRRELARADGTSRQNWPSQLLQAEAAALTSVHRRRLTEGRPVWPLALYLRLFHGVPLG